MSEAPSCGRLLCCSLSPCSLLACSSLARWLLGCLVLVCSLLSCASPEATVPVRTPPKTDFAVVAEDPKPLPRYHSKRLALSLPLPDGHAWHIDDHTRAELVATHPPTHSTILVAIIRTDELVGRTQCEELARMRKLVPVGNLRTLEDEVTVTQQTFDTRIVVAVEAGASPSQPIAGHVMAFGGFLRKCYVFDFSTQVAGSAEEPILSSRLATARARILGALELDPFAAIGRETPTGPEIAPTH